MEFLAPALVAASIALMGCGLAPRREPLAFVPETLPSSRREVRSMASRCLARMGRMKVAARFERPDQLHRRFELAGSPGSFEAVLGLRMALGLGVGLGTCLLAAVASPAILLAPVVGWVATRVPGVVLARAARRRQERIGARVPDLVELLVATTDAGLSPPVAFGRSAEVLAGPLGEEIRVAVREIELGLPWRAALERMVERTEVPSLRRLAGALGRSQRLGTSVGTALRSVAHDFRGEQRTRAEELARRAPIKMLFPLVFLILPAFLLLTVGPVVLATIRSLH